MAHFVGESKLVRFKDHVLLRNTSGRVGIWELYSVIYTAPGKFKAIGRLVGYQEDYEQQTEPDRGIRGLEIVVAAKEGSGLPAGGNSDKSSPESST